MDKIFFVWAFFLNAFILALIGASCSINGYPSISLSMTIDHIFMDILMIVISLLTLTLCGGFSFVLETIHAYKTIEFKAICIRNETRPNVMIGTFSQEAMASPPYWLAFYLLKFQQKVDGKDISYLKPGKKLR